MVVQQSTTEAFALTRAQKEATLWLFFFMIPPIIALAMGVARTITRPIKTGVGVAEKVAAPGRHGVYSLSHQTEVKQCPLDLMSNASTFTSQKKSPWPRAGR
jgi:hypothetical protein